MSLATLSPDQQQGSYADRDGDEHGNFAQCVETAEIDEDDVDDVESVSQTRRCVRRNSRPVVTLYRMHRRTTPRW